MIYPQDAYVGEWPNINLHLTQEDVFSQLVDTEDTPYRVGGGLILQGTGTRTLPKPHAV